jgi:hypothetical protein
VRLHNEQLITRPKTASEYCKRSGLSLGKLSEMTNKEFYELDEMYGYRFSQFAKVVAICARIERNREKANRI